MVSGQPGPPAPPGVDVGSRACAAPSAQPPGFEAVVTGETVIVVLRGELDMTVEGFLYGRLSRIREMRPSRLVFEMAQVSYLDCASARPLIGSSITPR